MTAISNHTIHSHEEQKLIFPRKVLYGPSRRLLQVNGKFEEKFVHVSNTMVQTVYVVSRLKLNLLGLPAITSLNLATTVDATTKAPSIIQIYPSVFNGLRNLGKEYIIKIKLGAKPYALFTLLEHFVIVTSQSEAGTGQDEVNWSNSTMNERQSGV